MKPYMYIRLTESPDVEEIKREGRKSIVGKIPRGSEITVYPDGIVEYADGTPGRTICKTKHNDRGYVRPSSKSVVRRALKKMDRRKGGADLINMEES